MTNERIPAEHTAPISDADLDRVQGAGRSNWTPISTVHQGIHKPSSAAPSSSEIKKHGARILKLG